MLPAEPAEPRAWRALLPIILALAALLRIGALDKSFYIDEIVTITVASQPPDHMDDVMRQIDASPALYPLLLHVWMGVSHADAWVRLLSAVFGLLAVYVVARLGRETLGWRAGLGAAAVMAVAPAHVEYAQYVRSYSLFTLLVTLHVLLFVRWMDERRPLTAWRFAAFTAVTAALLYTHYLSLLLFPVEAAFAAWRFRTLPNRAMLCGAALALGGVLFLPGIPLLMHNIEFDRIRNADRPAPPSAVRLVPDILGELSVGQRNLGFSDPTVRRVTLGLAALVFPALAILGIVRGVRTDRDLVFLLIAVTAVPLAIYIGSGRKLVAIRFFVPFAAGYVVLLGAGLSSLAARRAVAAWLVVAGICAIPLTHFYSRFDWSYDHRPVAEAIVRDAGPRDVLLVVHPYEAFYYRWYLGRRVPIKGLVFTALEDQGGYVIKPPPVTFARARGRILEAAATHDRFWFVGESTRSFVSNAREQERILTWMDETFERVRDLDYMTGGNPIVRLYARRGGAGPGS